MILRIIIHYLFGDCVFPCIYTTATAMASYADRLALVNKREMTLSYNPKTTITQTIAAYNSPYKEPQFDNN